MLKSFLFFVMMVFFPIISYTGLSQASADFQKQGQTEEEVHIYIPFEHQASIFMNADIIQRSPKIKKILWGYNRFQGNEEKFNIVHVGSQKLSNATEIQNGFLYSDLNELRQFYRRHPNAKYCIHTALFMSLTRLMPIFDIIPKENIKQIHLYESSVGRTLQRNTYLWKDHYTFNKEDLQTCIKYQCLKTWDLIFSLHLLYPTTYHLGLLSEIKNAPEMQNFVEGTKTATLENMDFMKLKDNLTKDQKNVLLDSYGVNLDNYKKVISGKKVNLFIIGHASDDMADNEFQKLQVAIQNWYHPERDKNELFFIKPGRDKSIMKKLREANINIPEFPISAPFELLILSDLTPELISGTSCSLFFNLPKEKIGKIYNTSPRGNHIPLLKKVFGKEKVVDVN